MEEMNYEDRKGALAYVIDDLKYADDTSTEKLMDSLDRMRENDVPKQSWFDILEQRIEYLEKLLSNFQGGVILEAKDKVSSVVEIINEFNKKEERYKIVVAESEYFDNLQMINNYQGIGVWDNENKKFV